MRLFCDDLRICPEGWTLARTNTEAIRLLASGYVSEISIDHDICVPNVEFIKESVRKRLAMGEETFQPIVYYICLMKPEDRPKKITIHTANPAAALRMSGLLFDAGIESEIKESGYAFDQGGNEL